MKIYFLEALKKKKFKTEKKEQQQEMENNTRKICWKKQIKGSEEKILALALFTLCLSMKH